MQLRYDADGRKTVEVPRDQYYAWLPNSHPAYIDVEQFEENLRRLAQNSRPTPDGEHSGAIREGSGLLQGIALCGICGRKMQVLYSESNYLHQPTYVCCFAKHHYNEALCQSVIGGNIDRTIEALVLDAINPMTSDAAISIQQEMTERKEEIIRIYAGQMERARYEMDLAKRRYLRVDPDNRLIAAELERDWNQKVGEYEAAKAVYDQKCETEIRAIDDKLKQALDQLVSDFPKIWSDPQTSIKEKKRIIRMVLEDVTITSDSSKIVLGVRFKGGAAQTIEIPRTKRDLRLVKMEEDDVLTIQSLLPLGLSNQEIADALNEKYRNHGIDRKPFKICNIASLIRKYNLPTRKEIMESDTDGWLTTQEKMDELGVSRGQLQRMRGAGKLVYKKSRLYNLVYLYKPEANKELNTVC